MAQIKEKVKRALKEYLTKVQRDIPIDFAILYGSQAKGQARPHRDIDIEHIMKKLPKFKTEEEEMKFWETHSIADYWDELEEGQDIFKRSKLTPVTLKFDPLVLKKIKMLARKRGISYNSYIPYLIAKSVEKEMLPANC